jgi:hypothetical protein
VTLFNRSLGDSYSVDSDIQELVAYYDKEFEREYAEHILAFLITRSIVSGQTMLYFISKCVRPEVFPLLFIEDIVAKILRFLETLLMFLLYFLRSHCHTIITTIVMLVLVTCITLEVIIGMARAIVLEIVLLIING